MYFERNIVYEEKEKYYEMQRHTIIIIFFKNVERQEELNSKRNFLNEKYLIFKLGLNANPSHH